MILFIQKLLQYTILPYNVTLQHHLNIFLLTEIVLILAMVLMFKIYGVNSIKWIWEEKYLLFFSLGKLTNKNKYESQFDYLHNKFSNYARYTMNVITLGYFC